MQKNMDLDNSFTNRKDAEDVKKKQNFVVGVQNFEFIQGGNYLHMLVQSC